MAYVLGESRPIFLTEDPIVPGGGKRRVAADASSDHDGQRVVIRCSAFGAVHLTRADLKAIAEAAEAAFAQMPDPADITGVEMRAQTTKARPAP